MSGVGASVVAVILAGGRGRRMAGGNGTIDKAMVLLAGRPLIAHVFARLAPQVAAIAISANGDPARFAAWLPSTHRASVPVLPDAPDGPEGPLAGLLAGARWAMAAHPGALLLSAPCDVPFLPADLVSRLAVAPLPAGAASDDRLHPLVALWRPATLVEAAAKGGSARALLSSLGGGSVVWQGGEDPFMNVNDPASLASAAQSRNAGQ